MFSVGKHGLELTRMIYVFIIAVIFLEGSALPKPASWLQLQVGSYHTSSVFAFENVWRALWRDTSYIGVRNKTYGMSKMRISCVVVDYCIVLRTEFQTDSVKREKRKVCSLDDKRRIILADKNHTAIRPNHDVWRERPSRQLSSISLSS